MSDPKDRADLVDLRCAGTVALGALRALYGTCQAHKINPVTSFYSLSFLVAMFLRNTYGEDQAAIDGAIASFNRNLEDALARVSRVAIEVPRNGGKVQ